MLRGRLPRGGPRRLGELFVLTGFVLAQPLFDVFGDGADIFVFRQAGQGDILQFTAIVAFVPALLLVLAETLLGLAWPRAVRPVHTAFVAALLVAGAVQLVKHLTPAAGWLLPAAALATGALLVAGYVRAAAARTWLVAALPAPLVFATLFLLAPPIRAQVLPARAAPVAEATGAEGHLVVLVLDELPLGSLLGADGRVDPGLYPNFAALAATSHFYRNATTNAWYTPYAVPAMLTGRYPSARRVATVGQYPENLFTLLGPDHHFNVHELLQLCPARRCGAQQAAVGQRGLRPLLRDAAAVARQVLSPSRRETDPTTSLVEAAQQGADAEADRRVGAPGFLWSTVRRNQPTRFTAFLESLDGTRPRSVNFLHLLMPHAPWRYLPDGTSYDSPSAAGLADHRWASPRAAEVARQRHLLQVRYTDALVGQLVARLRATGMWDSATVVVTSDHGISFRAGQRKRRVAQPTYPDLAWVPLFVKRPGQTAGRVEDENAQLVDVLPTIADAMGLALPWPVDGRSLFGPDRPLGERRVLYHAPGAAIRIDGPAGLRRVRASAVGHFAPGADPEWRLYRRGRLGDLVGTPVAERRSGPAAPGSATVANLAAFAAARPGASLPAYVHGTLAGAGPAAGQLVAVAVNGMIGTVGEVYEVGGELEFAGMLPPSVFRPGRNAVDVYLVEPAAGGPVLRPYLVRGPD